VYYTADVLRFFSLDNNGRFIVDDTSNEVKFADSGGGNQAPQTLGASLVVIYRRPQDPLRGIVLYHGGFTINQNSDSVTQLIKGWYEASAPPPSPPSPVAAKLRLIIGDGQANFPERVRFNGTAIADESNNFSPFIGPSWDNPTFNVSLAAGDASATVTIDHDGTPFDCLTGGAFIFSTTVKDTDTDGIVDILESAGTSGTITDPNNNLLPDLYALRGNLREPVILWTILTTRWG
jgi:hypothetical protein